MNQKPYMSLGEAIEQFLQKNGLETPAKIQRLTGNWESLFGQGIASHTEKIWFQQGTLFIKVDCPVWRHELSLGKKEILKTVNQFLEEDLVSAISIQ